MYQNMKETIITRKTPFLIVCKSPAGTTFSLPADENALMRFIDKLLAAQQMHEASVPFSLTDQQCLIGSAERGRFNRHEQPEKQEKIEKANDMIHNAYQEAAEDLRKEKEQELSKKKAALYKRSEFVEPLSEQLVTKGLMVRVLDPFALGLPFMEFSKGTLVELMEPIDPVPEGEGWYITEDLYLTNAELSNPNYCQLLGPA